MTDSPHEYGSVPPPELLPDVPRRGFFAQAMALVIGGIVALVPLVTGTLFFLDPLIRKKDESESDEGGDEGFVKLNITPEELKQSQVPIRVQVVSSKVDKWTRYPDTPIGSVYLHWQDDQVLAFSVTCPHLGCEVEYRKTPDEQVPEYYCPCHTSAFTLTGEKKNATPPRALDSLDVKIVKNDQDAEEIWVKYQQFRTGKKEKVPV